MKYIQDDDDDDVHECNGKLVAQWGIAGIVDIASFLFPFFRTPFSFWVPLVAPLRSDPRDL